MKSEAMLVPTYFAASIHRAMVMDALVNEIASGRVVAHQPGGPGRELCLYAAENAPEDVEMLTTDDAVGIIQGSIVMHLGILN